MIRKIRKIAIFLVAIILISPWLSYLLTQLLTAIAHFDSLQTLELDWNYIHGWMACLKEPQVRTGTIFIAVGLLFLYSYTGSFRVTAEIEDVDTMPVTDTIRIPKPAGSGQYGTARFMKGRELDTTYESYIAADPDPVKVPKQGGLVIGQEKSRKQEKTYYVGDDVHAIIIGATRSGKTRRVLLQSIWLTILAGESMYVTDPKGELWAYTAPFAQKHGYRVLTLDLRTPEKSDRYNFMQGINAAAKAGNISKATDLTWDFVSTLVGVPKGEPLWHDGQCATIAAAILIIAFEAPEKFRNMTNVYYFLSRMCEADAFGKMPVEDYLNKLSDNHPAKAVFSVAKVAPGKTRGSFFTSALATLRLFTSPSIAAVTGADDIRLDQLTEQKTIIYMIVPDEKTTMYGLISIFVKQLYEALTSEAVAAGGRLPIDWRFWLEEMGQQPAMPDFDSMLSVGGGRGIRFYPVLQSFQQLESKYDKVSEIIKDNCLTWLYLKSPNEKTWEVFSKKVGTYTVPVTSSSASSSGSHESGSISASKSLTGRSLLMADEVGRIDSPYMLVTSSGNNPVMMKARDISECLANKAFGLGSKEHNRKLQMERHAARPTRRIPEQIELWEIWKLYKRKPLAPVITPETEEKPGDTNSNGNRYLDFIKNN